jgi:hypothetical protein
MVLFNFSGGEWCGYVSMGCHRFHINKHHKDRLPPPVGARIDLANRLLEATRSTDGNETGSTYGRAAHATGNQLKSIDGSDRSRTYGPQLCPRLVLQLYWDFPAARLDLERTKMDQFCMFRVFALPRLSFLS